MAKVTYTYWRYHTKYIEEEDSLIDAVRRAVYAEDDGNASVESIITASGKVLDMDAIDAYWKQHEKLERRGQIREQARLLVLRYVDSRPIRWKEASSIIRRMRWKPYVTRYKGVRIIAADKWGKEVRIAAVSSWQKMTPARFWSRLRKIDPYRVAEVERNIF